MNHNNDLNNDRTTAFNVKKVLRRSDSVAWIISSLVMFFLNVISIGRITIIGQFIDDIIFTLPFGWFKYVMYLIFIGVTLCIYFGIRFKFKKRFILMVFGTWVAMAWIISAILYIVAFKLNISDLHVENYFSKNIFSDSIHAYIDNWKKYSEFGNFKSNSWIISNSNTYFSLWAGGGFIGSFLSAIFSYTTIYGNLVFSFIFFLMVVTWILTGDIFYFFKPKHKRTGKRLRILSLSAPRKRNLNKPLPVAKKNKSKLFVINYFDSQSSNLDIESSYTQADITIEMPGFKKNVERNYNDDVVDILNIVEDDFQYSNHQPYSEYQNQNRPVQYDQYLNQNNNNNNQYLNNNYNNQYENPVNYNNNLNNNSSFPERDNHFKKEFLQSEQDYLNTPQDLQVLQRAREKFKRDTSITPFGVNGKTEEYIREKNLSNQESQKNVFLDDLKETTFENKKNALNEASSQMTIDDFISEKNINHKEVRIPEYESPLQKRLAKNVYANGEYEWTDSFNSSKNVIRNNKKAQIISPSIYKVNKNYILPDVNLLNNEQRDESVIKRLNNEAAEKAQVINEVFDSFKVQAQVSEFLVGPSITQFIVSLNQGSKVQSVLGLENEIKLRLATQNVLIQAPISGKAAVGIEIPNSSVLPVNLKSVIGMAPLQKMNSKLLFPIGKSVAGNVIFGELSSMPHLLVAGSTGSGKSVMINSIITSILLRAKPHEVKMLMIDPKRVELAAYANIPHLLTPIISEMALAAGALKKIVLEMESRYDIFSRNNVKNIISYNQLKKNEEEKMPYYVVIIDELADLMLTENKKAVEESIMRLTQMARAAGIHLIVATQRPSTDVITGVIKANIPSRISFAVTNQYDSRTILDSNGAEKLVGKGDLLFIEPGIQKPTRAQGIYVSDEEIYRLTTFCAKQQEQDFDEKFLMNDIESNRDSYGNDELDPMYDEAIQLIAASGQASTSYLQRKLRIGYNRASRIIDQLEENGLIGPQNGAKSRDIYINNQ